MTTLDFTNQICTNSLKILGDFWTLRIIDALSESDLRYCELQRAAGNVNPVTLVNKLKKLEEAKLIERKTQSRTEVTYQLTALGRKALPILAAVNSFSQAAEDTYKS